MLLPRLCQRWQPGATWIPVRPHLSRDVGEDELPLLADAQTSGGLGGR
jgi:hypothetical protein